MKEAKGQVSGVSLDDVELLSVLNDAREFVITAVSESADIPGFDPTKHCLALRLAEQIKRLKKAIRASQK